MTLGQTGGVSSVREAEAREGENKEHRAMDPL